MTRPTMLIPTLVSSLLCACVAAGQPTHAVIGPDLTRRSVEFLGFDGGRLTVRDAGEVAAGRANLPTERMIDLEEVVALIPLGAILPVDPSAVLGPAGVVDDRPDAIIETVDGQRLWVELLTADASIDPPVVRARISTGAVVAIALERVSSIYTAESGETRPVTPDAEGFDAVAFGNGDVVSGFVASIGHEVVIETDGGDIRAPIARVARLTLANLPAPPAPTLIATIDGVIMAADALSGSPGRMIVSLADASVKPLRSEGAPREIGISVERLAGIVRGSSAGRLVPLGAGGPPTYEAAAGRRWTEAPVMPEGRAYLAGLGPITLRGPMSATWTTPEGATRFATELRLDRGPWASCEVTFVATVANGAEVELWTSALASGSTRTADVNVALPRGTVSITARIDAGAFGPVQDGVALEAARLLVGDGGG
ncbi:MAG: hypothetical protein CMJ31_00565 [Phycisphaerae bacterium]|nr:hypothetical protein [Phycisphaerae bacterium]